MFYTPGRWTGKDLDRIIQEANRISEPGQRIAFISEHFLGVPYAEATLVGDEQTPEEFVIDLGGVDCFTLLDYVEALRRSKSSADFPLQLKKIRYRNEVVSFSSRNHFFTDWAESSRDFIRDVTGEIGGNKVRRTVKMLNQKEDGSPILEGIPPFCREISYISADLSGLLPFSLMKTGDYAGIYSEKAGLDVSHVGIIILEGSAVMLRHASSARGVRKTIDQDLREYMRGKPGLLVFRSRD